MQLEKIYSEDLIFSNAIEDDRTNTYLTLNDYDWMDYQLSTKFKTKKQGTLHVSFEFYGTDESIMKVEQTKRKILVNKFTYTYPTEIFQRYITKYMLKHIAAWDDKYAFNGEKFVIDFFNEVIEVGKVKVE
jgi:hypothetical protein